MNDIWKKNPELKYLFIVLLAFVLMFGEYYLLYTYAPNTLLWLNEHVYVEQNVDNIFGTPFVAILLLVNVFLVGIPILRKSDTNAQS